MKNKNRYVLILILIFGTLLRFYNLGWGSPHFFHPDERNIAGSISRMYFEKTLNPHFFAYGSFWSYIALPAVALAKAWFNYDPFSTAIIFLRILSTLQGIGTIILSYFVGKILLSFVIPAKAGIQASNSKFKILNSKFYFLLPFLIATSPGLIQASHFGTFESSLAFLYFLLFYLCLRFVGAAPRGRPIFWFLICVIFGISISIRVTSVILLPILLLILFSNFKFSLISLFSLIALPALIFFLSNPFSINWSFFSNGTMEQWNNLPNIFSSDFSGTMKYESSVALGSLSVFYTQQFQNTIPIFYQFFRVLPFALNPIVWVIFISYIIVIPAKAGIYIIKKDKKNQIFLLIKKQWLLLLFFLLTFLSGSLMYVKWTRYIIPSLPFIYVFIFLFLSSLSFRRRPESKTFIFYLFPFTCLLFSVLFVSVYQKDTRVEAATWARANLPANSLILSEVYDMGIVPFNDSFHYSQIKLFNFYDLDDKNNDETEMEELKSLITQADVIILPSPRVWATRLVPNVAPSLSRGEVGYPNGNWFYRSLFSGKLGFRLVKTFSHPYEKFAFPFIKEDESFSVFDHPEVGIFVK